MTASQVERRYQVFISSTYEDLKEERHAVMSALLSLGCMPAGMELFPAADDEQWSLIKEVIDDCDYYVLLVGGRYGSRSEGGVSYTEMEYRYALEKGKPIIAFLHKDPETLPANRTEKNEDARARLVAFRGLAERKMCSYWASPSELGLLVTHGILRLMKRNPGVGWVRGDRVADITSAEVLRLRRRVEELEGTLANARSQAPPGADQLAKGDDEAFVEYSAELYSEGREHRGTLTSSSSITWNAVFEALAPLMIDEASEQELKSALNEALARLELHVTTDEDGEELYLADVEVTDKGFQQVKVQLRALGLIAKSSKQRSLRDRRTFWSLTPYGDDVMTANLAARKPIAF